MATTTGGISDFEARSDGASAEMVRAHLSTWNNFKRLILGGGCAAILALGVLWWITY